MFCFCISNGSDFSPVSIPLKINAPWAVSSAPPRLTLPTRPPKIVSGGGPQAPTRKGFALSELSLFTEQVSVKSTGTQ